MRTRPSSRLLVVDSENRLLLFRFDHREGALAGQVFWATPGGGVGTGESYEDAARRELLEETGLHVDDPGPQVHQRQVRFQMPDGERVVGDERYFLVRVGTADISNERWTALEREVMAEHRWWSLDELLSTSEQVWPEDIGGLLTKVGVWGAS